MSEQSKSKFLINVSFYAVIVALVYFSGNFLIKYFLPIVIAAVVAYFIQKPARQLSQKIKIKENVLAAILAFVVFMLAAVLLCSLIFALIASSKDIINNLKGFSTVLENFLARLEVLLSRMLSGFSPETAGIIGDSVLTAGQNVLTALLNGISNVVTGLVANIPSFVFSLIITIAAGCYMAKDYRILVKFFEYFSGKKIFGKVIKVKEIVGESIFKILKGYAIMLGVTFLELTVGLFVLRAPYPIPIAAAIALVDLLPVLGTGTVLIPWAVIEIIFSDAGFGIGLIVLYLILIFVKNFLEPKVIGHQIGINPLFTLIAMFLGLKFLGVAGLVIFPITLIVIIKYYKSQLEEES